jgi:hypothetical protein
MILYIFSVQSRLELSSNGNNYPTQCIQFILNLKSKLNKSNLLVRNMVVVGVGVFP